MSVRIIAIRKSGGNHYDPHESVSHYKWFNEQTRETNIADRLSMVKWVEDGGRAYVTGVEGVAECFVNQGALGNKFLQTNADSRASNNLLNLPEC